MKKYKYIQHGLVHFTAGGKEISMECGDEAELPADDAKVKQLVADKYLEEVKVAASAKEAKGAVKGN